MDELRWSGLNGGYRIPFDPRPLLAALEENPNNDRLWSELIENLYHQGDVGEASYAAVLRLVCLGDQEKVPPWQLLILVAMIDLARTQPGNPSVPKWLEDGYRQAIELIAIRCQQSFTMAGTPDQTRGMLCVFALWKGLRTYASALLSYSEEELQELLPW